MGGERGERRVRGEEEGAQVEGGEGEVVGCRGNHCIPHLFSLSPVISAAGVSKYLLFLSLFNTSRHELSHRTRAPKKTQHKSAKGRHATKDEERHSCALAPFMATPLDIVHTQGFFFFCIDINDHPSGKIVLYLFCLRGCFFIAKGQSKNNSATHLGLKLTFSVANVL